MPENKGNLRKEGRKRLSVVMAAVYIHQAGRCIRRQECEAGGHTVFVLSQEARGD